MNEDLLEIIQAHLDFDCNEESKWRNLTEKLLDQQKIIVSENEKLRKKLINMTVCNSSQFEFKVEGREIVRYIKDGDKHSSFPIDEIDVICEFISMLDNELWSVRGILSKKMNKMNNIISVINEVISNFED